MGNVSEFVSQYEKNFARYEEWKISDFKNRARTLEECVRFAVFGFLPNLKRDSHQNQLDKDVLEEVVENLLEENVLKLMHECKSFDDLFVVVYESKVSGFGALAVYDTTLRLGAYFNLSPEVVYLHRGAHDGAIKLLKESHYNQHVQYFLGNDSYPYISKEHFPEEVQQLSPHHIENFLCRFKSKF